MLQSAAGSNFGTDGVLKVDVEVGRTTPGRSCGSTCRRSRPGCQVTNVQLRMFAGGAVNGRTLQAIRVNAAWTEGGVDVGQPAGDHRSGGDHAVGQRLAGVGGDRPGPGDVLRRQPRVPHP